MTRATVVLVHGPCLGPWIWRDAVVPHLESLGLRCFVPDLHETWPRPTWSGAVARVGIARYVERLHATLADLTGPVILVGHSLGARVVEGLIERGHRDGAVLVSPTPPQGLEAEARALATRHPAALARALVARRPRLLLGEPDRPDPARVRDWLLGPRASDELVARVAASLRAEPFAACLDWLRPSPVPVPRDAGVPVLALAGRDDPLVTPAALRRAAAAWNAVAHVLPHAGHCPMLGPSGITLARHVERWLFDT
ncbi:MAG: alpha/beta hydrolase [Burkholderiales bacterium]